MDASQRERRSGELLGYVARAQAAYYVLTGVWALVSIGTFQKVTGPKTDLWLVKTVGVLVAVVGAVLDMAARRKGITPEIALLAVGSAAGLTAIDVVYVAKGRISPVYLLDAAAELGLIGAWTLAWGDHGQSHSG